MFVDGLWLSDVTIHIHREGTPIPKSMQIDHIRLSLSQTQVAALSVVLGLGMHSGELLCYTDDVLNKIMSDPNDNTIKDAYRILMSDANQKRRVAKVVFSPIADNEVISKSAMKNINETAEYSWDSDVMRRCFVDVNGETVDDQSAEFLEKELEPIINTNPEDDIAAYEASKEKEY